MYSTPQILAILGCDPAELRSLHGSGGVPKPALYSVTARAYTDADLAALKAALIRGRMPTTAAVCRDLGVTRNEVEGMQSRGMRAPTGMYGKRQVWTPDDIQQLKTWITEGR